MRTFLTIILFFPLLLQAQSKAGVLSQDEVLWYILNYHPVAKQSNLLLDQGESNLLKARGGFDPKVSVNVDQKYFDDKSYYSLVGSGLSIPTWYGIELKTGVDQNSGQFLNPMDNVPPGSLLYAGASITIGKGLFIDERRAALKQAKIFSSVTYAEQQTMMNDLLFEAITQYWKWVEVWNQLQVYEQALQLATTRYEAVVQTFELGDIPAIDTLEAFIMVQNREMNRLDFQMQYRNESLKLSNYLWFENNAPLVITAALRPPNYLNVDRSPIATGDQLDEIIQGLNDNHPEMRLYEYKLQSLDIDRRMKAEQLKPKLNLNYNTLNEPIGNEFIEGMDIGNYKWGLEFNMPILLRKERGDLALTKLKIQDATFGRNQKLLEIENKVRKFYNEQLNLQSQVDLYTSAVNNYNRMLDGERTKFNAGESSLFLVNQRERMLISASIKLTEVVSKFQIAQSGLRWAAGDLFSSVEELK